MEIERRRRRRKKRRPLWKIFGRDFRMQLPLVIALTLAAVLMGFIATKCSGVDVPVGVLTGQ